LNRSLPRFFPGFAHRSTGATCWTRPFVDGPEWRVFGIVVASALVLLVPGCIAAEPNPPSVVLISLDGTRPADLTPENLPTLVELGRRGARAERLVPVDPSNTFPSHVSLVTGVRPDIHRIVNNGFIDPERGLFVRNEAHLWLESEPIWSIAERNGIATASYYWVGSEGPWAGGPAPRHTRKFSSRTSEKAKVNRILKWLTMKDAKERPRLITSWFHGADHSGHDDGPGADSIHAALVEQDLEIARLVREMEAHQLFESTTLIFVSDHGMASAERRVNLGSLLGRAGLDVAVMGTGGFATIVFDEGEKSAQNVERVIEIARKAGLEAWARKRAPSDWHVTDPRFGDVVVRAPLGTAIVSPFMKLNGFHGYDAKLPEMAGILVAYGRGVEPGSDLGSVSSLAIAPTILRLLDLPVPDPMATAPVEGLLGGLSLPEIASGGAALESGDTPSR